MTTDMRTAPSGAATSGARKNIEDVLPLLANQHALVLFSGQPGDEDPGFLQVRFTLTGALDEWRLDQAWRSVVQQHPALRAFSNIDAPDDTAALAVGLVEAGYRCLKLKAGDEPDGALQSRVAAVRDAIGPDVPLRLDFNGSLPAETAAEVLAEVARFDIEYAEQPIPPAAGAEALARLRWVGAVPIAADESVRDLGTARVLIDSGAVDAMVVKPAHVGGLRQAEAIIELATSASVPVTISTLFETGVGLAGALHLAATAPGPQAHGLATAGMLETDLLREPLVVQAGRLVVPTGHGLGVELDSDAIERYRAT